MFLDMNLLREAIQNQRNGELKGATLHVALHAGKQFSHHLIRCAWKNTLTCTAEIIQAASSNTCLTKFWCNLQDHSTSMIPYRLSLLLCFSLICWKKFVTPEHIWQKSHCSHMVWTADLIRKQTSSAIIQRNHVRRRSTFGRSHRRSKAVPSCEHEEGQI